MAMTLRTKMDKMGKRNRNVGHKIMQFASVGFPLEFLSQMGFDVSFDDGHHWIWVSCEIIGMWIAVVVILAIMYALVFRN